MYRSLPLDVRPYKQTRVFTQDDMPQGLRKNHVTKPGVWALIHVIEGRLLYHVTDPSVPPMEFDLTSDTLPGLILPDELHHVEPIGAVRFYVEFHSVPTDAKSAEVEQDADPASVHR